MTLPPPPQKKVYDYCPKCNHRTETGPNGHYCPNCPWGREAQEAASAHWKDTPLSKHEIILPSGLVKCDRHGSIRDPKEEPCWACENDKPLPPERAYFEQDDIADTIKRIKEEEQPKQELIDGLMVSTDTLHYHLIPVVALRELTKRIMLGEQIKGKDAWNAMSDNQQVLNSRKALARRLGHTISHSIGLLEKLQQGIPFSPEDLGEAAAIMWGGMYAICAVNKRMEKINGTTDSSSTD